MPGDFDYLAVYIIPRDVWYIIPFAAIQARAMISLRDPRLANGRYHRYLEAWHLLTQKSRPGKLGEKRAHVRPVSTNRS